jgi:hypothetical protein
VLGFTPEWDYGSLVRLTDPSVLDITNHKLIISIDKAR